MGFHGSQGFFRFKGATSIPQKEAGISGDSRYTRAFIDREPITIHLPYTPTQTAGLRGDIPEGHSLPWSYVQQNWNRNPGIPNEFYDKTFTPDLVWNSYGSLQRLGEHVFLSESDGFVTLIRNPVASGTTQVNAGIPILFDEDIGSFLSVPYLWGSVIEGIHSGARRFIVGPTKNTISNPFYGAYDTTSLDELGKFGDIACSGTGDFGAGEMLFVMPDYGTTSTYDETRHDLFNYAAKVRVTSSQTNEPFNSNFLQNTPFSVENINYSGFRLRDRKKLPVPYFVPDEESLLSMVNGTTVEPDRTVYGTSANPRTPGFNTYVSWKYTGVKANPTRRHAFAITKRHLLSMSSPYHNYAYSSEAPYTKDPYGFAAAVTGYIPFTDHQPGDKVYFYDRIENRVIERTVVASMPFDVALVHNTINKMVNGAYPRLESTWNVQFLPQGCGPVITQPNGATYSLPCYSYTLANEGYNYTVAVGHMDEIYNDRDPVGGTSDYEFTDFNDRWLNPYPAISGEETALELSDTVTRFKDKFVQNTLYKNNFDDTFGPTSYYELIPHNANLGLDYGGVTSSSGGGWFDSLMPFNYPIRNTTSLLPLNLYSVNNSSGNNSLALQRLLSNNFIKSIAFENSIVDQLPTAENLRSSQISQSAGVVVYPSSQNTIQASVQTETITPTPSSIPPKEIDSSLPESKIEDQFYYLPSAARNAVAEYFPHGLNNIFYGSLNSNDEFRRLITWHYLTSHFKGLIDGKCSVHLLDQDLPDGVQPISFLDVRRSELHKHEVFFDDQMRGFAAKNCPPRSSFVPYQYFGIPSALCPNSYGLLSFARTYANPYAESMLSFRFARIGKCGDDVSNTLDSCGETGQTASGPNCRWRVWEIGVGSDIPIYPNYGNDTGYLGADVSEQNNCYECWYNQNDENGKSLPPNILNTDKLNDVTTDKISWGGSDLPGPLFTYGKSGTPILSRIVTNSVYGSMQDNYQYLYDYVITGHNGPDIKPGDAIFQNFSGGTGICSYPFDSTLGRVFAYSKDSGRLILSLRGSHPLLSSDLLVRCNETIRPIGATFGTTAGYVERVNYQNPCGTLPTDSFAEWSFKHELGKTGYGYTVKGTGLPYPNNTEVSTWFELQRGGPRIFGFYWSFGLWYEGWLEEKLSNSKNDNCGFVESTDPIPSSNVLYMATHNMGAFLSDQPIYYRSTDVNDPSQFYYFGKVEDLFYKMLNDFNTSNGVTAQYRCTKEILKFDGESNEYNYPNSVRVDRIKTPMPSLTKIYAGVNIRESGFLK